MAIPSDSKSVMHFRIMLTAEGGDAVSARVLDSPAGATTQPVRLNSSQLPRELRALDRNALPDPVRVRSWGEALYAALFTGDIHTKLETALALLDERRAAGAMLQISLDCGEAPAAAALPWEALWSPQRKALALYPGVTIVRQVKRSNTSAPSTGGALRVLVISADPQTLRQVNATEEWARVNAALSALEREGAVHLIHLENASFAALHKLLETTPIDVLHYIGHGAYDEEFQEGYLAFENERGEAQRITGLQLAQMIANLSPCRLVVLNACVSALGVGQELADHRAPLVVGMQFPITDVAAASFAESFYRALAQGRTVSEAVDRGRMAIYAQPNEAEWTAPVVFVDVSNAYPLVNLVHSPDTRDDRRWRRAVLMAGVSALVIVLTAVALYAMSLVLASIQPETVLNGSGTQTPGVMESTPLVIDFPPLPKSAPFLTTTVTLLRSPSCVLAQDALYAELSAVATRLSPPVMVALSDDSEHNVTDRESIRAEGLSNKSDLVIWCESGGTDTEPTLHFEILTHRASPEVYEPGVLSFAVSDQFERTAIGIVYYLRRDYGKAIPVLRTAAAAASSRPVVSVIQLLVGNALAFQRNYVEATATFSEVVKVQPNWAQAWHNLGVGEFYSAWGDLRTQSSHALTALETARQLDPNTELSLLAEARIYRWIVDEIDGSYAKALDACRQSTESADIVFQGLGSLCTSYTQLYARNRGIISELPDYPNSSLLNSAITPHYADPLAVEGAIEWTYWEEYGDEMSLHRARSLLANYLQQARDDVMFEESRALYDAIATDIWPTLAETASETKNVR